MDQFKRLALPSIAGMLLTLVVTSCASNSSATLATEAEAAPAATASVASEASPADAGTASPAAVADASAPAMEMAAAAPAAGVADIPAIVEPPRVVESCKKEQYTKFEEDSRNSIKAGWEASKAERFGVGFRNADEYKQWSNTHNVIFKQTNEACEVLAKCAKENPDSKQKQCAAQAESFRDWQVLAKKFSERVKAVETTQVDKLCSLEPNLGDPSRCFEELADNVTAVCKTDECHELARCWQNIAFMDAAIRQAETACGFARTKLEQCRAYTEQQGRRKAQLERCGKMHEKSNLRVMPVI